MIIIFIKFEYLIILNILCVFFLYYVFNDDDFYGGDVYYEGFYDDI